MRKTLLLAPLALIAAAPAAPQLDVNIGGRAVKTEDGSLRFGWPGVYFEGRFEGTGVTAEAEAGEEQLSLIVDGKQKALLVGPGRIRVSVDGLDPGTHVVRLEKLTESQSGGARFYGFKLAKRGKPLPVVPRARRIEFIGDSYTVGYGNTSPTRECDRQRVHDTTDTQQAFGPLLAKRLQADYRVMAYSGFGIVRNYNGGEPGDSMINRYPRTIPGDPGLAAMSGWDPQLIVINLGTNDFSTELHDGEAWADQPALRGAYRAAYVDFVRRLAAQHPRARFLLMGSDRFYGEVQQIAASASAFTSAPVTTVQFGDLELTGCNWHPSLKDHRALADQLEAVVAKMPGVWG